LKFTRQAAEDIEFWKRSSPQVLKRIKLLLADIEITPIFRPGQARSLET